MRNKAAEIVDNGQPATSNTQKLKHVFANVFGNMCPRKNMFAEFFTLPHLNLKEMEVYHTHVFICLI
jgi:hypothetical protein